MLGVEVGTEEQVDGEWDGGEHEHEIDGLSPDLQISGVQHRLTFSFATPSATSREMAKKISTAARTRMDCENQYVTK